MKIIIVFNNIDKSKILNTIKTYISIWPKSTFWSEYEGIQDLDNYDYTFILHQQGNIENLKKEILSILPNDYPAKYINISPEINLRMKFWRDITDIVVIGKPNVPINELCNFSTKLIHISE